MVFIGDFVLLLKKTGICGKMFFFQNIFGEMTKINPKKITKRYI
jgi:hypothetical protein